MTDLTQLFGDLVRLEIVLWNAVDARLRADLRTPLGSLQALQVVERTPGCRVDDVRRELSITVGGASKLVDRLEASGLCLRRPHPVDRRSSLVELSRAGGDVLAQGSVVLDDELRQRFAGLTPDGLQQLDRTITTLRKTQGTTTEGNLR